METKKSKKSIVFRYIFLSLYILCVLVILGLSLQNGEASSNVSGSVTDGIAGIIDGTSSSHESIIDTLKAKGYDLYLIIRKLFGHFGAFVVLGALASVVYLTFIKKKWIAITSLVGSGILIAGLSELLQLIPVGRCATWKDFGIDVSGYLVAICIGLVVFLFKLLKTLPKEEVKKETELDS